MLRRLSQICVDSARTCWRASRFLCRDPRSALLLLRMAWWVVALSVMVRALPLPRVFSIITPRHRHVSTGDSATTQARLAQLLDLLLSANWLVFTPTCWKRAAVLHRYLALNGIETQIVFGVRREGEGVLAGHAWLEVSGQPILEADAPNYRVTYSFPA